MNHRVSVFSFSLLTFCLLCLLFSSFQHPNDKNQLLSRIDYCKTLRLVDSLVVYQKSLNSLPNASDNPDILRSNANSMTFILDCSDVPLSRKLYLLNDFQLSPQWYQALLTKTALLQNLPDSADNCLRSLALFKQNNRPLLFAYCSLALFFADENLNLKKATEYLDDAASLPLHENDSILFFTTQAAVFCKSGRQAKAAAALKSLINQRSNLPLTDSFNLALNYLNLSDVFSLQSNVDDAVKSARSALAFLPQNNPQSNVELPAFRLQLAQALYNSDNKPLETILCLRKIFASQSPQNSPVFVRAANLMSKQFLKVNQSDSAQVFLNLYKKYAKKFPPNFFEPQFTEAALHLAKKNFKQAEAAFKLFVSDTEQFFGPHSLQSADALSRLGKFLLDIKKFKQALKILDKAAEAAAIVSADRFHHPDSVFSVKQLVDINCLSIRAMFGLYDQSKYNVSLLNIDRLCRYNQSLLNLINDNSGDFLKISISVIEQGIDVSYLLFERYKDLSYLKRAFYLSELSRKFHCNVAVTNPANHSFAKVPQDLIDSFTNLKNRIVWIKKNRLNALRSKDSVNIDWLSEQFLSLKGQLNDSKLKFKNEFPAYYHFISSDNLPAVDSIQMALPDSTALVQYFEGNNTLYQFLIRRDSFAVRKIFWRTYKPTVLKYYKHFTDPKLIQHTHSGGYKDFCRTSYELFYKMMHHNLYDNCNRLIIIPDGLLSFIPFETLLTDIPVDSVHNINFNNLDFLLKQKIISYNFSASLYLSCSKKGPLDNNKILGMSATYTDQVKADFRHESIINLRNNLRKSTHAAKEIDLLSQKYEGDFYNDKYATEYYLKDYAGEYNVLHLALQALVNQFQPGASCIALAEDAYQKEDNFLTVNEIVQLDLNASLVTLSNCSSYYGQLKRGEGLIAFGRSFMYAGCPALLMTLWNQKETYQPLLIDCFYQNVIAGMPKDKALQMAKIQFLNKAEGLNAHPAFWASFIQIGNSDAIQISEPVIHIWWFILPIAFLAFLGWWSLQALRQRR